MKRLIPWLYVLLAATHHQADAQTQKITYYYTDQQGSILAEADEVGNITKRFDYRPYGNQAMDIPEEGPSYTGHVHDTDTDLNYMQARYQDPSLGRFLSTDPVRASPGNVFSFNRYTYANNNPIVNVDPDGRTVTCNADNCTINSHSLIEVAVDYATVGIIYARRPIQNMGSAPPTIPIAQQESNDSSPPLPKSLVGEQDDMSKKQGKRVNSGPLDPTHGGTGDSAKDFDRLTGGNSSPAPAEKKYPSGTIVGENGISHRPATDTTGPRIDIPANGEKPPETLHYPKPDIPLL